LTQKKYFGIYRDLKCYFHEAPHIVAQLYGVPHGILEVFNPILYEKISPVQRVRFSPERSTLEVTGL
jgi:hypothetical protein